MAMDQDTNCCHSRNGPPTVTCGVDSASGFPALAPSKTGGSHMDSGSPDCLQPTVRRTINHVLQQHQVATSLTMPTCLSAMVGTNRQNDSNHSYCLCITSSQLYFSTTSVKLQAKSCYAPVLDRHHNLKSCVGAAIWLHAFLA
jgi:hypothetical protein